jgi:uncharacterized membrane protein
MNNLSTKRLCRAGVIAALYVVLTYAFLPVAFGPIQFRPAEALCILPLFFIEAVPALYVGCMIVNLSSPFLLYDVFLGSLATLLAGICTYLIGKTLKKEISRAVIGGIFPVLFNAIIIPFIIVFLCDGVGANQTVATAYFFNMLTIGLSECIGVYGLGLPLYYTLLKLKPLTR